jgi:cobalamin biosynthesis protein CobT
MDDVQQFKSSNPFHQPGAFAGNKFAGKTDELPRPERSDPEYGNVTAAQLKELQGKWDFAEGARVEREAAFAESKAQKLTRETEEKQRRDAESAAVLQAQRDKREAALLAPAKRAYLAGGGDPEKWSEVAPGIAEDIRREQAILAGRSVAGDRIHSSVADF